MAKLEVVLKFIPIGAPAKPALFITIDGRQALQEGPRSFGHCIYCNGQCNGETPHCEVRVFNESLSPAKKARKS